MFAPPLHYHVPHLRLRWDEQTLQISPRDVIRQLREGKPSIEVRSSPPDAVELGVWMLRNDEAEIVARRLREILQAHV
jgi:L-seryl-tRNA(Ser) seleniumtransferase